MTPPRRRENGRFEFGENWASFLKHLDVERIEAAEAGLRRVFGPRGIASDSFLDAGCGSGLSSLAARRLGATVHSFDRDPDCVACTQALRARFFPEDSRWSIEQGDALDAAYVGSLGQFDIVYSWGVLHHTGDMWLALARIVQAVRPGGRLLVAIYNDAGWRSRAWRIEKRVYVASPLLIRLAIALAFCSWFEIRSLVGWFACHRKRPWPRRWRETKCDRGMSLWHDMIDWLGGYPFECARPGEIFSFHQDRGFTLLYMNTAPGPMHCNEYVFARSIQSPRGAARVG